MFTDEHRSKTYHHEAGITFARSESVWLQNSLQELARRKFPKQTRNNWIDLHASPMWNGTVDKSGLKTDWSNYSQKDVFPFFVDAISMINERATDIYVQRLRRRGTGNTFFNDPERLYALRFLTHRLDKIARDGSGVGVLQADQESDFKVQRTMERKIWEYVASRSGNQYNKPIERVIMPINFVDSRYSAGVQAADLVSYVVSRILTNRVSPKSDFDYIQILERELSKLQISPIWPK